MAMVNKSDQIRDCGFPGLPQSSILTIRKNDQILGNWSYSSDLVNINQRSYNYKEKTTASYQCQDPGRYMLRGSKETTCLWNGQWEDHIPFCDENLAYKMAARVPGIEDTKWLTDGRMNSTEHRIRKWPDQYIELNFTHPVHLKTVVVHFKGLDENITEAELIVGNGTSCHFEKLFTHFLQYDCKHIVNSTKGLRFLHHSPMSYEIVEIQVFRRTAGTKHCSIPYIPSNGHTTLYPNNSHPELAVFGCSSGYQLIGSESQNCTGFNWAGPIPNCRIFNPGWTDKPEINFTESFSEIPHEVTRSVLSNQSFNEFEPRNETGNFCNEKTNSNDWLIALLIVSLSLVVIFAGLFLYASRQNKSQLVGYANISVSDEDVRNRVQEEHLPTNTDQVTEESGKYP